MTPEHETLVFWIGIFAFALNFTVFKTPLSLLIAWGCGFYLGSKSVVRILKARLKKAKFN